MMMKVRLIALLTTLTSQLAIGQSASKCDSLHAFFDSLQSNYVGLMRYDIPPELIGGYNKFYKSITEHTQAPGMNAKIYVQFIIDTVGNVQCAKVVKSDNEKLNEQAIALVEEAKFIPAEQRGKKVLSTLILPITFGPEPPGANKRKNKKRC